MHSDTRTILITGAAGFLGTYLADLCAGYGARLVGIDVNPPRKPAIWQAFHSISCESPLVGDVMRKERVTTVFHLAGGASVPMSVQNPFQDFSSFVPGTANLASYVREQSQCALVLFSSAAVYGNPISLPVHENAAIAPISPYGIHKAVGEGLLEHYARIFGFPLRIIRIFSAYGPGLRKQLIWDICEKAFAAVESGSDHIDLFGTGFETRDFIHVRDVARAALHVSSLAPDHPTTVFNVASGIQTRISEVAHKIVSQIDPRLKLTFSGTVRTGDPCQWCADVSKLSAGGFECTTSLDEGIKEVVEWARGIRGRVQD
ncbi:MAG: NAD-dependent epimerase/dehydratase family protein [Prosthecobacter sp.]